MGGRGNRQRGQRLEANLNKEVRAMPRGATSKYTNKQERKADPFAEGSE